MSGTNGLLIMLMLAVYDMFKHNILLNSRQTNGVLVLLPSGTSGFTFQSCSILSVRLIASH